MKTSLRQECCLLAKCFLLFAGITVVGGCCGISPASETYTNVTLMRVAIGEFVAAYRRAPENLEELALYRPDATTWNDGWGRALLYHVGSSAVVELTSLGKDNRRGGSGQNADLVWRFTLKDRAGDWIGTNWQKGGFDEWLEHPFRPARPSHSQKPS